MIHYDEPTRIIEIIQQDPKEYQWIQKYNKKIIKKIGKEKIRKYKEKRWREYYKKYE